MSRVSVLLGLVHDPRAIRSGIDRLSGSDRDRSTALEMLEVTLGRTTLARVLTVVDPLLDEEERRARCALGEGPPVRTLLEWLDDLVRDPDGYWHEPWLRTCALRAVPGRMEPVTAAALATPWRDDEDPAVAQTARWVGWIVAGADRGAVAATAVVG